MEDEIAYMWNHPPRCTGGPARRATGELRAFLGEQLGENATVFVLQCACGGERLGVNCSSDPIVVRIACEACGVERVAFDGSEHGYDGELGLALESEQEAAASHRCAGCDQAGHEVALAFQYGGETDILEEDDPPDVQPEDLFGWLMVGAKCSGCGALGLVAEQECA